jgi:hypothetical protein
MKSATHYCIAVSLLCAISLPALAQHSYYEAPSSVESDVPFDLKFFLDCPATEAPPEPYCAPGLNATFQTSDPGGSVPNGVVLIPPNSLFTVPGHFVLRTLGQQTISVLYDGRPFEQITIEVRSAPRAVPALNAWGILFAVIGFVLLCRRFGNPASPT